MEIIKGIEILGKSLWLRKEKILIISDLHIGYEECLNKKGILVPRIQFKEIFNELERLLKQVNPKTIVVNGDLKHEFGEISNQEWSETLKILDLLLEKAKVVLIKGNHDNILKPIAGKRGLKIVDKYETDDICIVHGDNILKTDKKIVIIGHEHPAISLKEGIKTERYKCFLLGKYKNKKMVVMPSFLPIIEGTDVLKGKLLSPYLKNIDNFDVFAVGDKVYKFGKVEDIK